MNFCLTKSDIDDAILSMVEDGICVMYSEFPFLNGLPIDKYDLRARRMNFGWRLSFLYRADSGDDYIKLGNIINSLSNRLPADKISEVKYQSFYNIDNLKYDSPDYIFHYYGKITNDSKDVFDNREDKKIHVIDIILNTDANEILDFFECRKKEKKIVKTSSKYDFSDPESVKRYLFETLDCDFKSERNSYEYIAQDYGYRDYDSDFY